MSGRAARSPLITSASRTASGPQSGWALSTIAAHPATSGEEYDVPLPCPYRSRVRAVTRATPEPIATRSGFTRPSHVGPAELKATMRPFQSTAPTEITPGASAGGVNVLSPRPVFPIEFTIRRPRSNATVAQPLISAVLPSRAFGAYHEEYH